MDYWTHYTIEAALGANEPVWRQAYLTGKLAKDNPAAAKIMDEILASNKAGGAATVHLKILLDPETKSPEVKNKAMAELAKLMNGKGNVAILAGNQNAPNLQRRVQGAKTEAAKYPGIKIVGVFNHIETPQDASAEVVRVNNAYPEITGWAFIGGWPLWTQSLLTDINPAKMKIASVDALPSQLVYVDRGIVPVLLAQSVYLWGHQGVTTLFEKVHDNKQPANPIIPMELVRVTKDNLGDWARQLKEWGFTDVDPKYLALPSAKK